MIGDTGIELVHGGFNAGSGQLILRGAADPDTYSAVLQSLVLENAGPAGLATGSRSVTVAVRDGEGAEAVQQSVTLVVEPPPAWAEPATEAGPLAHHDPQADVMAASALVAQELDGADHAGASSWTDHVGDGAAAPVLHEAWTHAGQPAEQASAQAHAVALADHLPTMPGEDATVLHGFMDRPHWA
jgi:hypothetical protein